MVTGRAAALRSILADGPIEWPAVRQAMRAAGHDVSDKALQRLCSRLEVRRVRADFGGRFSLALTPDGSAAQGVHVGSDQERREAAASPSLRGPQTAMILRLVATCPGCRRPTTVLMVPSGLCPRCVEAKQLDPKEDR